MPHARDRRRRPILLVDEVGSDLAAQLWDGCDAAVSSRLAYPEVRAALAAATRDRDLDEEGLTAALAAWEEFWAAVRPVELTRQVERRAGSSPRPGRWAAPTLFISPALSSWATRLS